MVIELIRPDGLLLRRDAVAAGYTDRNLAQARRAGVIVRIRQGAYARADLWQKLDRRGRHLLLSTAVMLQYDDGVALSHGSAALALGGPDYGIDLDGVHLTHFDGGGRRAAGVVHHQGVCRVSDITRMRRHWVTSPARTVLDIAVTQGVEAAVVVGDDFVHRGLTSVEELTQLADSMSLWPGALRVRMVVALIDGRAESVGETLFRLLCRHMGLPRPELQYDVYGPGGVLLGRVDFHWKAHRVIGEFDGKRKYLANRRPGESITDAVLREKRRESLVCEASGCRMVRFIWPDLFTPERTAERLWGVLERAA